MAALQVWWMTWRTAWLAAVANRRGFVTQITIMIVNDVVWVLFWVLVFSRVDEIRGWRLGDVIVLFAVLTTSAGVVLGALHNSRQIADYVLSGKLDALLNLPGPTLPHLLLRRVETLFIGDAIFGVLLFVLLGDPSPGRFAVFAFGVVCAVVIQVGFLVAAGSSAFFIRQQEPGEMGLHSILLFSSYPVDVFGGATKFLLYVVVPAGFVSSVPARLIDDFDLRWAAATVAVAATVALVGRQVFQLGLRRYTSGSSWV
ncbi:MAG: ABC-2 family transporter protein [Actinomycetota bacterium]